LTQKTELTSLDDGRRPRAIGDAGARTLLLADDGGGSRPNGGASFLLPHLAVAVRAEEIARKHTEWSSAAKGTNSRKQRAAAMAMEAQAEKEQMENYHSCAAT